MNRVVFLILISIRTAGAGGGTTLPPPEDRGLYALWYNNRNREAILSLPFITGGQIIHQWRDLEPKTG